MTLSHTWKTESVGMHDTLYKCTTCQKTQMESIDNPVTTLNEEEDCPVLVSQFQKAMTDTTQDLTMQDAVDAANGSLLQEIANLREQVIQQQARIVELSYYLDRSITTFQTIPKTVEKRARKALATTDDLSALAEHDKQVWNEAVEAVALHMAFETTSTEPANTIRELKR